MNPSEQQAEIAASNPVAGGGITEAPEIVEEEVLAIVEIHEHAGTGKRKPKAHEYAFFVGKHRFVVKDPIISGREILQIAGDVPPEKYILRQILHGGGEPKIVELDEKVDLRAPGVERFRAMPRTASDG